MNQGRRLAAGAASCWVLVFATDPAMGQTPLGTAFSYQGRLADAGAPANGAYDFQFILYSAAVGGSQVGPIVTKDDVTIASGLFTVSLDFGGAAFAGNARWLDIAIRPGASTGSYTPLAGRQELTPAANAIYSTSTGEAPWSGLTGVPTGFADGLDNDSGGDVTAVAAGTGLTGGGTSGALTLSANFGGSGVANTVARSDHDHFGQTWTNSSTYGLRVENQSPTGIGFYGSGTNLGVWGASTSTAGYGVYGVASASSGPNSGIRGESSSTVGVGVFGWASATSGLNSGVRGESASTAGRGVVGYAPAPGWAGYFTGNVNVSGTLSKGGGAFKIDHPLDPENRYLYHSFVESPDMKNVYDGVVRTDESGYAMVELPAWFEALNRDFRYQLTVIDENDSSEFVLAKVVQEVRDNRFRLRTSSPNVRVSWQLTGIRKDAWAEKNRIPVEQDKPEDERGLYLHPLENGQPEEKGIDYRERRAHDPPAETTRIPGMRPQR